MKLYFHPMSSYSQKTVMAFHEKGAAFEPVLVNAMDATAKADYRKIHPLGKLPFLHVEEGDLRIPESSIIIEYIDRHCPGGTKLIPDDPDLAREVRFRDRFFDFYINDAMQKIFFDRLRPEGHRDPHGVERARETLDAALGLLETHMATRTWAIGEDLTMADCAAAPALRYCRMVHPYDDHPNVVAYAKRLYERPSYQKLFKEAEPFLAAFAAGNK